MAYVDLKLAKQHLIVDESFTDDDEYIKMLIEAAEKTVSMDVCEEFKDMEDEEGKIPAPLRHAILLQVGDYYAHRETVSFGSTMREIPSYQKIISLYRNYEK